MKKSELSVRYMEVPMPICFSLLRHLVVFARSRALFNAGRSIEARIAMIAITTSNSIRVNLRILLGSLPPGIAIPMTTVKPLSINFIISGILYFLTVM